MDAHTRGNIKMYENTIVMTIKMSNVYEIILITSKNIKVYLILTHIDQSNKKENYIKTISSHNYYPKSKTKTNLYNILI